LGEFLVPSEALDNFAHHQILVCRTAVFAFEGIGLVIPITESMKDPHKFPKVLSGVMVGIMVLFAGAGGLSYAAYGKDIQVSLNSGPDETE